MSRMVDALCELARRTSTSFAELRDSGLRADPQDTLIEDGLVYRLRQWPSLPPSLRTAPVLRLLSLMSNRPLNRQWMTSHTRLSPESVDALLKRLIAQNAVEVIDTNHYGGHAIRR